MRPSFKGCWRNANAMVFTPISKISNFKQLIERSESISISSDDDIYPIESDLEIEDEAVNRVKNLILKWKDGIKPKRPIAYTKDSRTTK
jgi:hypothetical protein